MGKDLHNKGVAKHEAKMKISFSITSKLQAKKNRRFKHAKRSKLIRSKRLKKN